MQEFAEGVKIFNSNKINSSSNEDKALLKILNSK